MIMVMIWPHLEVVVYFVQVQFGSLSYDRFVGLDTWMFGVLLVLTKFLFSCWILCPD